jgi:hypothetical protein
MPRHYFARHIAVVKDPAELIYMLTKKENIGKEVLYACSLKDDDSNSKYNQKIRVKQIKNSNLVEFRVGASNLDEANACMNSLKNYISSLLNIEVNKIYSALNALEKLNKSRLDEIKKDFGLNKELFGVIEKEVITIYTTLKDIEESKFKNIHYSEIKFTDNSTEKYTFYLHYYNYYLYSALVLFFMQKFLQYFLRSKLKFY